MQSLEDKELLFEKLYNKYNRSIYNYIYMSIKDQWQVEDLTSEVFIKVYKHRDKINDIDKSGMWLKTIAKNTLIDYYRKGNREEPSDFIDVEGCFDWEYDNILIRDELKYIRVMVEELPKDVKRMVLMRYYYGMKFKDIAKQMNLTENAVKCKVCRTLKKLRNSIKLKQVS